MSSAGCDRQPGVQKRSKTWNFHETGNDPFRVRLEVDILIHFTP